MDQTTQKTYLDRIYTATTNKSLKSTLVEAIGEFGYHRWIYVSENSFSPLKLPVTLAHGYTSRWLMTYMFKRYQDVDPVISHCLNNHAPLYWDSYVGWEDADPKVQQFMEDVFNNGFGSGLAIPLLPRTAEEPKGFINITSAKHLDVEKSRYSEHLETLRILGQAAHETMVAMMSKNIHN